MKKAIAILTYARPFYFELVLASIIEQRIGDRALKDDYDIFIFQDGLFEHDSEINRHGHNLIGMLLDSMPTHIRVIKQGANLGVALHFDFIERLLFDELAYDYVVFCEDDLILAPGYIQVLDLMGQGFFNDPRVGMVSAHPAHPMASTSDQRAKRDRYAAMGHNWGFGLTQHFWRKRQPLVDCYLDVLRKTPYRDRPTREICAWLERIGFKGNASSQDYIKQCATIALGACRLSTFSNFALPIGRIGLHCTPELFRKMGLENTIVSDEPLQAIAELDDQQFRAIYEYQACQILGGLDSPTIKEMDGWQQRLRSGELHPRHFISRLFM